MATIERVKPGDKITAKWANALGDSVRDISEGRLPAPLMNRILAAMLVAIDADRFVLVKIVQVRTQGTPVTTTEGPCWLPSQVSYHIIGIEKPGIDLDEAKPSYGRPVKGDSRRIYPAKVGMTAVLERERQDDGTVAARFMLLPDSEIVAVKRCGG